MYFESHAHYDDRKFNPDRESVINSLKSGGIDYVVNVGADMPSSLASIKLADKYDFFYAAVGVHPHEVKDMNEGDISTLRDHSKHKKVVAIGEIGLDYFYDNSPRDLQVFWFERQLELAKELDLPIIIHSREATEQTLQIVKKSGVRKGVVHCFSGSAAVALEYVKMGFYIGVGGVVTYSNAKALVETVKVIPIERLLLETDCPYLPPVPHRGERNVSQNLLYICDKISNIKQIPNEEVAKITFNNCVHLFAI